MKMLLLSAILSIAGVANAKAISVTCKCVDAFCSQNTNPVKVAFDTKTLFFEIDGVTWSYAGYAARQTSNVTGANYLILPAGVSMDKTVIQTKVDDENPHRIEVSGNTYECQ